MLKRTIAKKLIISGVVFFTSSMVLADDGEFFDSRFLFRPDNQALPSDLSVFRHANLILPGDHQVTLQVNQRPYGEKTVLFIPDTDASKDAIPCVTLGLLHEADVNVDAFEEYKDKSELACLDLGVIPLASYSYDQSAGKLSLSIPQAALKAVARGFVPIELWDSGENAVWASYQLSHFRSSFDSQAGKNKNNSTYLSLRGGVNLGAWRFRTQGNYYDSDGSRHWNFNENYFERDITSWRSRIRLGDNTTDGSVFTASRIRGVNLRSDDGMLATSEQGYAPSIEGFANTSAKVTIRQNENVVYSTFVAPGRFVINDLYAVPGGGDLEVEIEEAGGHIVRYLQPYSVLPTMLRQGRWQYNASLGQYRGYNSDSDTPIVAQATFAHGLPKEITLFGGAMVSKNYWAHSLGLALNMKRFGGISADVVQSRSRDYKDQKESGHALRFQYAKNLMETGTNFRLFAYRYSSSGYRNLDEVLNTYNGNNQSTLWNKSHEYQLSVTQSLNEYGSLSAAYAKIQFHNNVRPSDSLSIGYSNNYKSLSYNINYNMIDSEWQKRSHGIMLNVSIPLGKSGTYTGYSFSRNNDGYTSHDATLSGTALEHNKLSYSVRAGTTRDESSSGGNFYVGSSYKASVGELTASYAHSANSTQEQYSFSGSALLDSKGMLLGQHMGGTAIIVDAPGAKNVTLASHPTIKTDKAGRALIPYATPYRENYVSLEPNYQSDEVVLIQNNLTVVPTQGAVVYATFATEAGRSFIFSLTHQGKTVPFGASVFNTEGESIGIVGPVGRLWLSGLTETHRYTVKWGEASQQMQCDIEIDASKVPASSETSEMDLLCE